MSELDGPEPLVECRVVSALQGFDGKVWETWVNGILRVGFNVVAETKAEAEDTARETLIREDADWRRRYAPGDPAPHEHQLEQVERLRSVFGPRQPLR